jgi:hypothetical protein
MACGRFKTALQAVVAALAFAAIYSALSGQWPDAAVITLAAIVLTPIALML